LNGKTDAGATSKDEASQAATEGSEPKQDGVLEIDKRVVCLGDVDGRVNGAKQLVVSRGAVVTPAVRDLLRQSGVELTYRVPSRNGKAVRPPVAAGLVETSFDPTALLRSVAPTDTTFELVAGTDLLEVVDQLTKRVLEGRPALLLTSQVAASLCLANRMSGVRAVCGATVQEISRVLGEVGGNMLVLDPNGKSQFELRRMVDELVRDARQAPERLKNRLA
jgi:hypothetical protein